MRLNLGRFFVLVILAAPSACSGPAAHETPSFAVPSVDRTQRTPESSVRFWVYNSTAKTFQQGELGGYCVPTMAARDVKPGTTIEIVGVASGCLTLAAFDVRLRDVAAGKSIYFSANYETTGGIFSQAKVRSTSVPYTGVCTNVDPEAAVLYISTSGCGGGGGTIAKSQGPQTFTLRIDNRTGIDLVGKTVWSYCTSTKLQGFLGAGGTLIAGIATKGGSQACKHIANFATDYYELHSGNLVEEIEWTFTAPHKTQLAVDGFKGYCARSHPKELVRFYKAGINGCY